MKIGKISAILRKAPLKFEVFLFKISKRASDLINKSCRVTGERMTQFDCKLKEISNWR